MERTFYGRSGNAIAYTEDGVHIYLFSGKPVAYLDGESVYSFGGRHLGWYLDGWIWDNHGYAVLFTEEATGGPGRPGMSGKPGKGGKSGIPGKGGQARRPGRPGLSGKWSSMWVEDLPADTPAFRTSSAWLRP